MAGYETIRFSSERMGGEAAIYTSPATVRAWNEILDGVDLYGAVRIDQILDAAINRGMVLGAAAAFDEVERVGLEQARENITHRGPGRPRLR